MKSMLIKIAFVITIFLSIINVTNAAEKKQNRIYCDKDNDCFLLPQGPLGDPVPALIYLSCDGGTPSLIDSVRTVFDSLGWGIAVAGNVKNHQPISYNEDQILKIIDKLNSTGKIDHKKIVLFGFSGQGSQALGTALRHPELIAGAITECAHTGAITKFKPDLSANQVFYLITRVKDWNKSFNEEIEYFFRVNSIDDTLVITSGEHSIGPHWEVLKGCCWINNVWTIRELQLDD